MVVAKLTVVRLPKIIDFAMAPAKAGPCSSMNMVMVDRKIAGKTEMMPLNVAPTLASSTARAIIDPAKNPLSSIFCHV